MTDDPNSQLYKRDAILNAAVQLIKEGQVLFSRIRVALRAGINQKIVSKEFKSLYTLMDPNPRHHRRSQADST